MIRGGVDYNGYTLEDAKASVGPGWAKILDQLWADLPSCAVVVQVKEKWGRLRIYQEGSDPAIESLLDLAETRSGLTCEQCGGRGTGTTDERWMKTLCAACRAKEGRS